MFLDDSSAHVWRGMFQMVELENLGPTLLSLTVQEITTSINPPDEEVQINWRHTGN